MNKNKIVFFGLAGTGTSSTGKALAKKLGLTFMSTGDLMRKKAYTLNMSIYDFDRLCQKEPKYDVELDLMVKKYGEKQKNFIFESRLAWYFIPDAIKIYFHCDDSLSYKRIAMRDNLSFIDAKKLTKERAEIVGNRYSNIYSHIVFPPKKEFFDYVIDTTKDTIEESVEKIEVFLSIFQKS